LGEVGHHRLEYPRIERGRGVIVHVNRQLQSRGHEEIDAEGGAKRGSAALLTAGAYRPPAPGVWVGPGVARIGDRSAPEAPSRTRFDKLPDRSSWPEARARGDGAPGGVAAPPRASPGTPPEVDRRRRGRTRTAPLLAR